MLSHPFQSFLKRMVGPRGRFARRAGRQARLIHRLRRPSNWHSAAETLEDRLLLAATLSPSHGSSISTATASTTPQLKTAVSSPPTIGGLASQVNIAENGSYQFWTTLMDPAATSTSETLSLSVTNGRLFFQTSNGLTFISGANDSSSMTVTGTLANLQTAIDGVSYDPTIGVVGSDTLQVTLANSSDNLSGSATVSIALIVPPSVGTPQRSTFGSTATVLNDSSYTFAPGTFALSDINASGSSDSAQIFVASVANGPGIATLGSTAGVTVIKGSNGSSSMTINGTLASLNAALNTLIYTPNAPFTGEAQVYVVLNNSLNGLSAPNGVTFDVLDPNGPSVIGPASETLALNQPLAFTGTNTFSVTDPQASGTSDSVRIALTYGTVSLGTTNGLTFTNGSNNSHLMTVMGTLADLNAALSTLTYTAQNGLAGANPLYIDVNNSIDNLTAADIVPMIIAAPALNAPATESLNGTGSLTFPAGSINVTDTGAIYYLDGFAYESVTLSAANGALTLGSTSGLLYSYGANNSSVISVTGTLANVNAALSGLVYTPTSGFTGSDALQISFKDVFDGLIASATVPLTVTGVVNPGTQNNAVGDTVSLQVQASGLASGDSWTYSATGLPSGLYI
ncbi:MAG TPA: hypothetical protein VGP63_07230, partial [Planctomycetaceae bacterium]|nr:hypothetical protein [Planctomycetaceae bacterium]